MAIDVIVGLQRGDEGKGRFVDMLAKNYGIVARFNGGNNAGHTVVLSDGSVLKLHLVPSGIAHPGVVNVIGSGTLVNPVKLAEEIAHIESNGIEVTRDNLKLDSASHLILPHHIYEDEIREAGDRRQGSTKSGIAQVASLKAMRTGARTELIKNAPEELFELVYNGLLAQRPLRLDAGLENIDEEKVAREYVESAKGLGHFVTDTVFYLNQELNKEPGVQVLAEGAQAFWLDIDHGMYPYTTSSSTTAGGVCTGLGVPPSCVGKVTGVIKAVQSHVGDGPFVTEVTDSEPLARLHGDLTTVDAERGTTTGRTRRLGHLDLVQIRRANMINGTNEMVLSKLDWVSRYGEKIQICTSYMRKGKQLEVAPGSARKLDQSTPQYEYLPAWDEDIQDVRRFEDLPKNAQEYITFIEDKTNVPITRIGVGPQPEQVIER